MGLLDTGSIAGGKELFQSLMFKALYHGGNYSPVFTVAQQSIYCLTAFFGLCLAGKKVNGVFVVLVLSHPMPP